MVRWETPWPLPDLSLVDKHHGLCARNLIGAHSLVQVVHLIRKRSLSGMSGRAKGCLHHWASMACRAVGDVEGWVAWEVCNETQRLDGISQWSKVGEEEGRHPVLCFHSRYRSDQNGAACRKVRKEVEETNWQGYLHGQSRPCRSSPDSVTVCMAGNYSANVEATSGSSPRRYPPSHNGLELCSCAALHLHCCPTSLHVSWVDNNPMRSSSGEVSDRSFHMALGCLTADHREKQPPTLQRACRIPKCLIPPFIGRRCCCV